MTKPIISLPRFLKLEGRLATQPVRVMGFALYISIFIVEQIFLAVQWCGSEYKSSWIAIVLLVFGAYIALEWVEQRYWLVKPALWLAVGAIGLRILLTEIAGLYACSGFHTFFSFIPVLLAYLYIGQRAALITAAINLLLYINWLSSDGMITLEFLRDENVVVELLITIVGMVLMLILGRTLLLEEENRQRANQLFIELEASQKQVTELAKADERNRIARDIHDSVGHHLMAVTVQLEKAKAFRPVNPDEADQALDDAKLAAQSALAEVRESVSALRSSGSQFEFQDALHQLVEGYSHRSIELTFEGEEAPFAQTALMALYRVAQEGLTNIEKHADAMHVTLHAILQPEQVKLILSDDGRGFSPTDLASKTDSSHAHFGLTGLHERLALLGGRLVVESKSKQGTTLTASVPVKRYE